MIKNIHRSLSAITSIIPWYSGEPNNDNEDCVHLFTSQNYYWNDISCTTLNYPICNQVPTISCPRNSEKIISGFNDIGGCGLEDCDNRYNFNNINSFFFF